MNAIDLSSRRKFIKLFTLGAAVSFLDGRIWKSPFVTEASAAAPGAGFLTLRVSDFSALQSANGSVRFSVNSFSSTGANPYYPVLVNRGSGSHFFALQARCNHAGGVVAAFNGSFCVCQFHGSLFGIDGSLQAGPANQGLVQYPITFDGNDKLTIELPNLGYAVTAAAVQGTPGSRLQLDFPTQSALTYEVRHRQNLADSGVIASFATTLNGTANQTAIAGNGSTRSVFVDRINSTGFYTVNVKVTQG